MSSFTNIASGLAKDVCVGETGSVKVRVVRTLFENKTRWRVQIYRPGITINASSADPGIASLLQASQITGFDPDLPGEVEFDYRGVKEGTTTLTFKADNLTGLVGERFDLPNNGATLSIPVKVIPCRV